MTLDSFMSFAYSRYVRFPLNSENVRDTMWKRWAAEMRCLRILARNPTLAEQANQTMCFSQEALRSEARYHMVVGRIENKKMIVA